MPHHHLNKPALRSALAGGVMSCSVLLFTTEPANAQLFNHAAGPERNDTGLMEGATSVPVEAGSISPPPSYASFPDAGIFADSSDRRFVLDNPMAQAVPLSGAIIPPAARGFQASATDLVEYTLLIDALQDSGPYNGFAGAVGHMRNERDWRNISNILFAGSDIQNPPVEQNLAAHSYGFYDDSVVYGENRTDLSPLYYRPLTERLNLTVHTYIGYEDTSPGNSDPIPYTGIGLTVSREAWPK